MNARQYALSIYRQAALLAKGEKATSDEKQESHQLEKALRDYEARNERKATKTLNHLVMGA